MEIGVKKYFTINGIKDNEIVKESNIEKIISVLEKILGNAVYVNISDDTRYYLENESYITYKDYILDESENKNNRMFTCCERKLLSKFFKMKVNDTEIKIVTTKLPCLLCKRTINIIEKRTKFRISVVCGESELSKEMVQEMDSIASNILSISSKK